MQFLLFDLVASTNSVKNTQNSNANRGNTSCAGHHADGFYRVSPSIWGRCGGCLSGWVRKTPSWRKCILDVSMQLRRLLRALGVSCSLISEDSYLVMAPLAWLSCPENHGARTRCQVQKSNAVTTMTWNTGSHSENGFKSLFFKERDLAHFGQRGLPPTVAVAVRKFVLQRTERQSTCGEGSR